MSEAFGVSLKVLLADIPLLLLVGGLLGWILARKNFWGKSLVSLLVQLPIVLPPSVMGFYLLFSLGRVELFQKAGFVFGFPGAALAAFIPAVPIMIQSSRAAFSSVNRDLEETALTMGKSKFAVFWKITFPLAKRTLLIGLGLSSARVLGDFGVTLMVAGNIPGRTQTLPLYIYGQVESLNFAQAHFAALLLVGIGIASLWFVKSLETGAHERIY